MLSIKTTYVLMFSLLLFSFSSCKKKSNRALVVGKIKKAAKLSTTEFTIDKIVNGTKTRKLAWFISLNESRFIAYSRAYIKAGVDLEKIQREDVKIYDDNSIEIVFPAVEIINFSYPARDFKRDNIISDDAFMNKISVYDQEKFFMDAEIDIRNNLEFMGIVKSTEQKTRTMMETLLKSLGYSDISISFKKGKLINKITTN